MSDKVRVGLGWSGCKGSEHGEARSLTSRKFAPVETTAMDVRSQEIFESEVESRV